MVQTRSMTKAAKAGKTEWEEKPKKVEKKVTITKPASTGTNKTTRKVQRSARSQREITKPKATEEEAAPSVEEEEEAEEEEVEELTPKEKDLFRNFQGVERMLAERGRRIREDIISLAEDVSANPNESQEDVAIVNLVHCTSLRVTDYQPNCYASDANYEDIRIIRRFSVADGQLLIEGTEFSKAGTVRSFTQPVAGTDDVEGMIFRYNPKKEGDEDFGKSAAGMLNRDWEIEKVNEGDLIYCKSPLATGKDPVFNFLGVVRGAIKHGDKLSSITAYPLTRDGIPCFGTSEMVKTHRLLGDTICVLPQNADKTQWNRFVNECQSAEDLKIACQYLQGHYVGFYNIRSEDDYNQGIAIRAGVSEKPNELSKVRVVVAYEPPDSTSAVLVENADIRNLVMLDLNQTRNAPQISKDSSTMREGLATLLTLYERPYFYCHMPVAPDDILENDITELVEALYNPQSAFSTAIVHALDLTVKRLKTIFAGTRHVETVEQLEKSVNDPENEFGKWATLTPEQEAEFAGSSSGGYGYVPARGASDVVVLTGGTKATKELAGIEAGTLDVSTVPIPGLSHAVRIRLQCKDGNGTTVLTAAARNLYIHNGHCIVVLHGRKTLTFVPDAKTLPSIQVHNLSGRESVPASGSFHIDVNGNEKEYVVRYDISANGHHGNYLLLDQTFKGEGGAASEKVSIALIKVLGHNYAFAGFKIEGLTGTAAPEITTENTKTEEAKEESSEEKEEEEEAEEEAEEEE